MSKVPWLLPDAVSKSVSSSPRPIIPIWYNLKEVTHEFVRFIRDILIITHNLKDLNGTGYCNVDNVGRE